MTREEAITIIRSLMLMMKNPQGKVISDGYYALEMAIQALEREPKTEPCEDCIRKQDEIRKAYDRGIKNGLIPKETCEDCISREAVDILVDELARAISDERCCISRGRSTATIMQDILDLPLVTPQPKTDVLDKIRAEIESIEITCDSSLSGDKRTDAEKCKDWVKLHSLIVLQIIDKYKAESEG